MTDFDKQELIQAVQGAQYGKVWHVPGKTLTEEDLRLVQETRMAPVRHSWSNDIEIGGV